ncbi:MAG: insulinase family protein, partial [Rhodobacteraceae bacterium]|nr:insulinase family protein [Paracoccaceae bacterium]
IEVERGVILQEIGQALDTPDDIIFDWLQEVSYPGQAIGRTILGPAERVAAFGRADFRAFTAAHYGPERLILSAAGAVDHDAILRQAEHLMGHLAPRGAERLAPARFEGGERREVKALEQAHLAMAFEAPGIRDDAVYAAQVWSMAMGGGMSSRLFQEAREKRGLCYTIFAQAGSFIDSGTVTIYAGTSEADIGALVDLTADEIRRATDTMTPAEIARARAQMKAGLLMGLESPSSRAERLARNVAIWGRVPGLDEIVSRIDAVTVRDVAGFGAQLAGSAPALTLYGPVDRAPSLQAFRERLAA